MSKHWFAVLVVTLLALGAPAAVAQTVEGKSLDDPKTEALAFDIAQRTMSPFCPGRTLADCPSPNATEWRQEIRAMLKQGMSPAEIQKALNKRAGENLTGAPESSLGWALPVALCAGALIVLTLVLRRFRSDDAADAAKSKNSSSRPSRADEEEEDDEDDEDTEGDHESNVPAARQRSDKQERELEERLRRELADDDA